MPTSEHRLAPQTRFLYDRRLPGWTTQPAHIFEALYDCGLPLVEVVVNNEFNRTQAATEARKYSRIVGQLPPGLRQNVKQIWIHDGNRQAGGGNESILIHTLQAQRRWPFIEEILLHEAAHTSLDYTWDGAVDQHEWARAAELDGQYISTYAQNNPEREDIAESYIAYALWTVLNRRQDDPGIADLIHSTIPKRLAYMASLGQEYAPSSRSCPVYGPPLSPSKVTKLRAKHLGDTVAVSWKPPRSWGAGTRKWFQYRIGKQPWTTTRASTVNIEAIELKTSSIRVRALNESGAGTVSRIKL